MRIRNVPARLVVGAMANTADARFHLSLRSCCHESIVDERSLSSSAHGEDHAEIRASRTTAGNLERLWGQFPTAGLLRLWAIIERMKTRCARCNAPMICNPTGDCWCSELPHGPMPTGTGGCLCRDCLTEELKQSSKEGRRSFPETLNRNSNCR
jgi:hypothetical protein